MRRVADRRPGALARMGRRNVRRLKVAVLVGLFLSLFPLAEVLARWFAPELPAWQGGDNSTVVMTGHPTRLWGLSEGIRANMGTTARVNAWGFRGSIPELPRPDGLERILVLGDSTFFGHGVGDGYTLVEVLESSLQDRGVNVEVVNGGVPGYSTEQALLWLDDVGWGLEPTLVVVGSLFSDTNFDAFRDKDLLESRRFADYNPLAHSAAFRLLVSWVSMALPGRKGKIVVFSQRQGWPSDGVRRVPVRDYAVNLSTIARQAAAVGAGVAFVAPIALEAVAKPAGDADLWDPYLDAQAAVAGYYGVPAVRFLDTFRRTLDEHIGFRGNTTSSREEEALTFLFLDDYHPTLLGHRIMGTELATALDEAGWPNETLEVDQDDELSSEFLGALADPWEDDPESINARSPHARLFSSTADEPLIEGSGFSPSAADRHADATWDLVGEAKYQAGPIRMEVRTTEGRSVSAALLAQPGPFSLRVANSYAEVVVTFTGPDGATAQSIAQQGGPEIEVVLGVTQ